MKTLFALMASFVIVMPCVYSGCDDRMWNGCHFNGYVDWLFWKVRRPGLDFCAEYDLCNASYVNQYRLVEPKYQSGFRVGLGVENVCSDLNFDALFTRYTNSESHSTGSNEALWATRTSPDYDFIVPEANSQYQFDYNCVDLLVTSHNFCGCFKPFLGLRLASIQEKLHTKYWECCSATKVRESLKSEAIGLNIGFEYTKKLMLNLNFYTRFGVSFLAGEINKRHKEWVVLTANDPLIDAHLKEWELLTTGDLAIGLESELCRCGDLLLTAMLGYEFHQWQNYPDFFNFTSSNNLASHSRNTSSLGLDGVYLRLKGCY